MDYAKIVLDDLKEDWIARDTAVLKKRFVRSGSGAYAAFHQTAYFWGAFDNMLRYDAEGARSIVQRVLTGKTISPELDFTIEVMLAIGEFIKDDDEPKKDDREGDGPLMAQ
jgi:hypothetical protein